jgi:hypothetical protein
MGNKIIIHRWLLDKRYEAGTFKSEVRYNYDNWSCFLPEMQFWLPRVKDEDFRRLGKYPIHFIAGGV